MESGVQIVKKEHKTFVRRRRLPPSSSLSSSSSVPLNPAPSISPRPSAPAVPPLKKKTRDLPNFSECHACGFRVDAVDGRSRLNSLYSEWRIVLLCKNCFFLVESSQVCSYCFADSVGDCLNCCECNRRVHKDCFSQYSRVAPWSYYSSSSEVSVCIDCWVPKPILTARAVLESKKIRRKNIRDSDLQSSKVSTGESCKSLSDVVKDAESLVEKKIDAAARARELALEKAAVARRAVELASDALNLVSQRDESDAKDSGDFADDAELAIQLHRAMNSSPRFSKNLCSMNSNYMAIQNAGVDDGVPSDGALYPVDCDYFKTPQVLVYKKCRCAGNAASEASVTAKYHDSPMDINRLESAGCKEPMKGISHPCVAEPENVELTPKDQGSSLIKLMRSGCDDNSFYPESQQPHKQDRHTMPTDERCIAKPYHYFFKYKRRDTTKRYVLKYRKRNSRLKSVPDCRPKIIVDGICLEVQYPSAETLVSSSEEFPAISNASSDSCALPLQDSGCVCYAVQETSDEGFRAFQDILQNFGESTATFVRHHGHSRRELLSGPRQRPWKLSKDDGSYVISSGCVDSYDQLSQRKILNSELSDVFGHLNINSEVDGQLVPIDDRTIFLTFFKGYPISEDEVCD